MNTHLAIYEEFGLKAQWRHLGEPHAYMFAESGAMNSLVHQWVYKDAADREKRRAAMAADPDWQVYVKKLSEFGPADGPADLADGAGEVCAADEEVACSSSASRPAQRHAPGLSPGIHVLLYRSKAWIAGSSPAMTPCYNCKLKIQGETQCCAPMTAPAPAAKS